MRQSIFVIPLLVLFSMEGARGANKKIVSPPGTKPGGNYSQGILIGPANECRLHQLLQRSEADEDDSSSRGTVGAGNIEITAARK
jgi:hypothetical protein